MSGVLSISNFSTISASTDVGEGEDSDDAHRNHCKNHASGEAHIGGGGHTSSLHVRIGGIGRTLGLAGRGHVGVHADRRLAGRGVAGRYVPGHVDAGHGRWRLGLTGHGVGWLGNWHNFQPEQHIIHDGHTVHGSDKHGNSDQVNNAHGNGGYGEGEHDTGGHGTGENGNVEQGAGEHGNGEGGGAGPSKCTKPILFSLRLEYSHVSFKHTALFDCCFTACLNNACNSGAELCGFLNSFS